MAHVGRAGFFRVIPRPIPSPGARKWLAEARSQRRGDKRRGFEQITDQAPCRPRLATRANIMKLRVFIRGHTAAIGRTRTLQRFRTSPIVLLATSPKDMLSGIVG